MRGRATPTRWVGSRHARGARELDVDEELHHGGRKKALGERVLVQHDREPVGHVAPVAVVRAASPDGAPTANDLEVVLKSC